MNNMLQKICLAVLMIMSAVLGHAQSQSEQDSIPETAESRFEVYLAPSYTASQLVETVASFAGISAGILYKRKLETYVYFGVVVDDFQQYVIYPTLYNFDQMNAGIYFQYQFTEKRLRPLVGVGAQFAQLSWIAEDNRDETYTDHIFLANPYLGAIWDLNDWLSFQANIGYSLPGEVELVSFIKEDFQGIKIDAAIRINVFSF